jgi:hypothetical protein
LNLKKVEQKNEERLHRLVASNKRLASRLDNEQNEFIPYHMSKMKVDGDEYLKKSLLKVKEQR